MTYYIKDYVTKTIMDSQSSKMYVDTLFKHQKDELLEEIAKIPSRTRKVIEFDREIIPPNVEQDHLCNTLCVSSLTITDVIDKKTIVIPKPKPFITHKGFWKKLKLLFSKKIVYTEN